MAEYRHHHHRGSTLWGPICFLRSCSATLKYMAYVAVFKTDYNTLSYPRGGGSSQPLPPQYL